MDHHFPSHTPPQPQSIMEVESVLMLVERIGLPAVIIGIMCWYIFKTQQSHKEEIIRWEEKDTRGDERLIDVIKEQNKQNSITSDAVNGLSVAFKDVAKTNERLSMEIKGMAEGLIANRKYCTKESRFVESATVIRVHVMTT